MDSDSIYTDIVMEHGLNSPYKKSLENENACSVGHNPNCGDKITLHALIEDGIIKDMSFSGSGCAISQGSTSVMIQTLLGKDVATARSIVSSFLRLIKREHVSQEERDMLHDALAFENVSLMPARVKCASLSWHTLEDMLNRLERY